MITPLDIENKEFKNGMFGYDKADVEEFLDQVLTDFEALYKENIALKDKVSTLSDGINQYKTMEDSLQNALLIAQATGEEVKKSAQEKAENIVKEAELRASEIINNANHEILDITNQYNNVKREFEAFKAQINSIIKSQERLLNDFPNHEAHFDQNTGRLSLD